MLLPLHSAAEDWSGPGGAPTEDAALYLELDGWEGPLDLLLYLIRKQHFNVLDIPMAPLTVHYLAYIDQIREKNLELAGEYLLMAALLI